MGNPRIDIYRSGDFFYPDLQADLDIEEGECGYEKKLD